MPRPSTTTATPSASPTLSSVSNTSSDDEDNFIPRSSASALNHRDAHRPQSQSRKRKAPSSASLHEYQQLAPAVRMQRERQRAATQACRERKAQHVRELETYISHMDANGGYSDETRELRRRVLELESENAALASAMTATAAASVRSDAISASDSPVALSDRCSTDLSSLSLPDFLNAFSATCGSEQSLIGNASGMSWSLGAQPLIGGEQWFF
ncbi:hypothetical protein HDU84_008110 [Entophlyctis sp. JEL0112]|nr:hypothetical protein HDU84_008110 [Entophlyctis sp. JEL0112]